MKGIILAGGSGTRLYPMTQIISKQLLPIYDKPMIFYPLSLLMLGGIREILIISTERDTPHIKKLLGDGSDFGIQLSYQVQHAPNGLAEAFILGEQFIGDDHVTLILGDNLFYGDIAFFKEAVKSQEKRSDQYRCRIFGYYVEDPTPYGVVEFEKGTGRVLSIEEKPVHPKSNYAIPGIYVFDSQCSKRARAQKPSTRGELEITDLIQTYLDEGSLGMQVIGRGVNWLDTGTPDHLAEASQLIATVQKRQGLKIGCLHEVALRRNFISLEKFDEAVEALPKSLYKEYLKRVREEWEQSHDLD